MNQQNLNTNKETGKSLDCVKRGTFFVFKSSSCGCVNWNNGFHGQAVLNIWLLTWCVWSWWLTIIFLLFVFGGWRNSQLLTFFIIPIWILKMIQSPHIYGKPHGLLILPFLCGCSEVGKMLPVEFIYLLEGIKGQPILTQIINQLILGWLSIKQMNMELIHLLIVSKQLTCFRQNLVYTKH